MLQGEQDNKRERTSKIVPTAPIQIDKVQRWHDILDIFNNNLYPKYFTTEKIKKKLDKIQEEMRRWLSDEDQS